MYFAIWSPSSSCDILKKRTLPTIQWEVFIRMALLANKCCRLALVTPYWSHSLHNNDGMVQLQFPIIHLPDTTSIWDLWPTDDNGWCFAVQCSLLYVKKQNCLYFNIYHRQQHAVYSKTNHNEANPWRQAADLACLGNFVPDWQLFFQSLEGISESASHLFSKVIGEWRREAEKRSIRQLEADFHSNSSSILRCLCVVCK